MKIRARYIGERNEGEAFTAWDIKFPEGKFVEVTDTKAIEKITGNKYFEIEAADAKKSDASKNAEGAK